MNATLATVAVIAATASTLVFVIPQTVKLVRTGDSSGVSTTWPALGFVSNIGWLIYMVHEERWASILAPTGAFVGYAVTLWALGRIGRPLRASQLRGVGFAAILVAVTLTAGWSALGVALGLSFGVMLAPSLWSAYQSPDPSGVSPGTWWIGMAEAALWGYYGLYHSDVGIITFAVVAAIGSALMLARYYGTRPRSPVEQAA